MRQMLFPIRSIAVWTTLVFLIVTLGAGETAAQQQRARPPVFDQQTTSRVFFPDLSSALRGERPSLSSLQKSDAEAAQAQANMAKESGSNSTEKKWNELISAVSLEDEIKRVKLKFDGVITTPGAFNGGGYQDARLHLSVLASLFAVISEYSGDVRWKSDAKTARDITAKTALNCAAGSTPVYNEARLRKADLQDLVSGAGLSVAKAGEDENDWSMIADRSPLMEYAELVLDDLSDVTNDTDSAKDNIDVVRRNAELLAVLGEILIQEGMDDSEDDDYKALSSAMTEASRSVVMALERQDFDGVRESVGAITQSCSACHEEYR
ncbi:cytochrome c [Rhodopirellula sallentina]|uniref:Putative membrane or secreted protein n=1 Tax=Rhodopirellula sallentina SM41 TaxID=1263870 RepID=M5TWW1_9BACT|nr:cytochrome c [Rhodopirellula sallentina]EMI53534.1 putative membrane or secreted protein [Rhodopirellula sallentina SM41]